jgi:TP901 family phage tail tape measure protein
MASAYSIYTTFKLIDEITKPLNRIGKLGVGAADALKKSYGAAEKRVDAFGAKLKQVLSYAPLALAGAATAAVTASARQLVEFDDAVTKSGALFADTQNLKGDAFKNALKDIGAEARRVAAATEFNAADTAGALQKMAMAGMSAKTSMELLSGTTDLATAAGTDLTAAVGIAADTLGALGMAANAVNLKRVSDAMAKTASAFNTDLQPMFEAITYAGPTFTTAGQSIDTLSASIGVLANAGIKGSGAGTALNAVFTQLSSATKQNALGKLGIQTKDAEGNFLNLFDIVGQLQNKLSGMGNAQKSAILTEIFDTRGAKAMNILLGAGVDELKKYEAMIKQSGGAAADMANIMRGSLKNQIERLGGSLSELGFKFVETFQQKGTDTIGKLTGVIDSIDMSSLSAKILAGIEVIEGIVSILWRFRGAIGFVLVSMLAYKTAMSAWVVYSRAAAIFTDILAGAQMAYRSVVLGSTAATSALAFTEGRAATSAAFFSGVLKTNNKLLGFFRDKNILATGSVAAQTAVTGAATGAQWSLNAALAANPIGFVITAVVALITVLVLLVKNLDYVGAVFKAVFAGIALAISLPIWGIFELINLLSGGKLDSTIKQMRKTNMEIIDFGWNAIPKVKEDRAAKKAAKEKEEMDKLMSQYDMSEYTEEMNKLMGEYDMSKYTPFDISEFGVDPSDFTSGFSAGGKSKLHGVYRIDGAVPSLGGGSARGAPGGMAESAQSAVDSAVRMILNTVRSIDRNVTGIAAWSFAPDSPLVPAPVTAGTRAAYSAAYMPAQERRETVVIELRAAQGTDAEIVSASPQTNIRLVRSGGNAK